MSITEEDLTDLRTRLLKRHAEEIAREIAALDPRFEKAAIVVLAMSDTGGDDDIQKLSMVSNAVDTNYLRGVLRFAANRDLNARKPFPQAH